MPTLKCLVLSVDTRTNNLKVLEVISSIISIQVKINNFGNKSIIEKYTFFSVHINQQKYFFFLVEATTIRKKRLRIREN